MKMKLTSKLFHNSGNILAIFPNPTHRVIISEEVKKEYFLCFLFFSELNLWTTNQDLWSIAQFFVMVFLNLSTFPVGHNEVLYCIHDLLQIL